MWRDWRFDRGCGNFSLTEDFCGFSARKDDVQERVAEASRSGDNCSVSVCEEEEGWMSF